MKTERSECFFTSANLQKIAELKSMSGLFFLLFNFALLPAFCQYNVICSAFCSYSLWICRSSGGKFILFWRWGKEGREKLFCRHGFWCWWSGMQMCFYRCGGLYCSICKQTWKNLKQHRNNWTPQCFNIKLHHKNITPHRKNIKSQRYNITPHRANIKPQDKNIELHR